MSILFTSSASARDIRIALEQNQKRVYVSSNTELLVLKPQQTSNTQVDSQMQYVLYKFPAKHSVLIRRAKAFDGKYILSSGKYLYETHEDFILASKSKVLGYKTGKISFLKRYRGKLAVHTVDDDLESFHLINQLPIETYLKSVVSSEMPSAWPLEALKAQAICARTYTYSNLGKYSKEGFDLRDDVGDQMYLGIKSERVSVINAVKQTSHQIMRDKQGRFVEAFYSSSAGPRSSQPEDVWGIAPRHYLLSVRDDATDSGYQNWTRSYSQSQLTSKFKDFGFKKITDVIITQYTVSGRAKRVYVIAGAKKVLLTGEEFRHRLGLPSTMISLEKKTTELNLLKKLQMQGTRNKDEGSWVSSNDLRMNESNTAGGGFGAVSKLTIHGKGFGHGIGLSQYGAMNLAKQGENYAEILNHYYQGIAIEELVD